MFRKSFDILTCFKFLSFTFVIISLSLNPENFKSITILFDTVKKSEFHQKFDQYSLSFFEEGDVTLIVYVFNLMNEITLLLILTLLMYYVIFLFNFNAVSIIGRNLRLIVKYLKIKSLTFKSKVFYLKLFPFLFPFIFYFVFGDSSLKTHLPPFIILMSIVLLFIHKTVSFKIIYLSLFFSVILTVFIDFYIFSNILKDFSLLFTKEDSFLYAKLIANTYISTSLTITFFLALIGVIKIEYFIARTRKKYISTEKIFSINFQSKENSIKELKRFIVDRKSQTKYMRAVELSKVLKQRNHENLIISIFFVLIFLLLIHVYIFLELEQINELLIVTLIFITIKYLMRIYEIIFSFFKDATSDKEKSSNLSNMDRIKLILKSLLEIIILSFYLKLNYFLLIESVELNSEFFIDMLDILYSSIATQLFNISYTNEYGFFPAFIHIMQIIVSACLILLCLALYGGKNKDKMNFEVINITYQNYELIEYTFYKSICVKRTKLKFESFEEVHKSWENNNISTDEYLLILNKILDYEYWIKLNDDLYYKIVDFVNRA